MLCWQVYHSPLKQELLKGAAGELEDEDDVEDTAGTLLAPITQSPTLRLTPAPSLHGQLQMHREANVGRVTRATVATQSMSRMHLRGTC